MSRYLRLSLPGIVLAVAVLLCATAPVAAAGTVIASQAWIRLPPAAAGVAAGYVQLYNGGRADRLLAARAAGFGQVQIHAMRMDGEVMRMQALPDGLALPAGQVTTLQPGGLHLMLIAPERPLRAGQQVAVTLQFATADERTVVFVVAQGSGGHGAGR